MRPPRRERALHGDTGHNQILQSDACSVEKCDLIFSLPARVRAVDHSTNRGDVSFGDQTGCDGMLCLADGGRLRDLIRKDPRRGDQCRLHLLLALGVRAHTGEMRAWLDPVFHQKRFKGRGDGDDHIRLGAKRLALQCLER